MKLIIYLLIIYFSNGPFNWFLGSEMELNIYLSPKWLPPKLGGKPNNYLIIYSQWYATMGVAIVEIINSIIKHPQ